MANWRAVASSADGGIKLAAVIANSSIYTSTDSGQRLAFENWPAPKPGRPWLHPPMEQDCGSPCRMVKSILRRIPGRTGLGSRLRRSRGSPSRVPRMEINCWRRAAVVICVHQCGRQLVAGGRHRQPGGIFGGWHEAGRGGRAGLYLRRFWSELGVQQCAHEVVCARVIG